MMQCIGKSSWRIELGQCAGRKDCVSWKSIGKKNYLKKFYNKSKTWIPREEGFYALTNVNISPKQENAEDNIQNY